MSHMLFAPTGLLKRSPLRAEKLAQLRAELAAEHLASINKTSRAAKRRVAHHKFKQTGERAAA